MVGYIVIQTANSPFAQFLIRYGYMYNLPVYAIEFHALMDHFHGLPLLGSRWDGEKVVTEQIPLPTLIDTEGALFSKKNASHFEPGFLSWLESQATVLHQHSLGKRRLAEAMLTGGLAQYAIPTWLIKTYTELKSLLPLVKSAVLKPSGGHQGKGVCKLFTNDQGETFVRTSEGCFPLSESFFESQLQENISDNLGNAFLLQPCLDFTLDDMHALDFRLLRHRDINGNWKEVMSCARLGGTSLVANYAQGGTVLGVKEAIRMIAPEDQCEELYDCMMQLGQEVTLIIEKMRAVENVFCLGIDIAVDRATLCPYVVEANTYPGLPEADTHKFAEARAEYYIYLLEKAGKL